jgi:hypothetical protein
MARFIEKSAHFRIGNESITIKYTAAARMQIVASIKIPADAVKRGSAGAAAVIPAAGSACSTQIKLRRTDLSF